MDRRTFIAAGAASAISAAGVTVAGAATAPASPAAPAATLAAPPPAASDYVCNFAAVVPTVFPGGEIRSVTDATFPVLVGISFAAVVLKPGAIRVPHWHSGNELALVTYGSTRFGMIVNGVGSEYSVKEGETVFLPAGWVHYFENASRTKEARLYFTYTDAAIKTYDLGASLKTLSPDAVSHSLGITAAQLSAIPASQPKLRDAR
ncbi:MAG: cupin domain-containing protein [Thermoleophilia bacterium]